ncbi:MAG TPA: hypothetical protein VFI35_08240 [Actinomycetota bacterium]|nr:hypothetical protein [Actinomycetota bacterium]
MDPGVVFDDIDRVDSSPSKHAEPAFVFLNRVAGPFWDRTRSTVSDWFGRLPVDMQPDVLGRLRSGDDRQLSGAFWEMYVHEALSREGFDLVPHPVVPGTQSRPDFAATRIDASFYVEATVIGESAAEAAADRRRNVIYDSLNAVDSPNFFLGLEVEAEGATSPSARRLRTDLEHWLGNLDPDKATEAMKSGLDLLPTFRWDAEGWTVSFRAIPKNEDSRGKPGVRPLGMFGPGRAAAVYDVGQVRSDLGEKAGKYDRPDLPFLIAASVESPFFDAEHTTSGALFGREAVQFDPDSMESRSIRTPDGLWTSPSGPRNTRVSAVLIVQNVSPWHFLHREPIVWNNPWAALPLPDVLPWEARKVDLGHGTLVKRDATRRAHEVLGVPEGWPGPEDPIPDA